MKEYAGTQLILNAMADMQEPVIANEMYRRLKSAMSKDDFVNATNRLLTNGTIRFSNWGDHTALVLAK